jgi:hypothetical protein
MKDENSSRTMMIGEILSYSKKKPNIIKVNVNLHLGHYQFPSIYERG